MYRLSQIILILVFALQINYGQNPHGKDFIIDCARCHTSDSWDVDIKNISFDHKETHFVLEGMHSNINCNECHKSLILSEVKDECIDCHEDIHNGTVSPNCSECHSDEDWLIEDFSAIHEEKGFPLVGLHWVLDCSECHEKSVELIFEPLDNACIACHESNYNNTTSPNHIEENFPEECDQCHELEAETWIISHDFFPLEKAHNIKDCSSCHTSSNYMDTSPECYSCHSKDYDNTVNPDHQVGSFSKDCSECHSLDPGWSPAKYENHDENDFPIFSGKHKGEWSQCSDCHIDPGDYSVFTCLDCHKHEKSKMDDKHDEESGYVYESEACYKCHPDGSE